MAEIGALSLRIQETGGQQVVNRLRQVDNAAKVTTQSVETVAAVLRQLGIGAKVSGSQIAVAAEQMEQAATIAGKMGQAQAIVAAGAAQAAGAQKAQAAATTTTAQAAGTYTAQVARATTATTTATQATQAQTVATTRQTAATKALGGTFTKADGQLTGFSKRGISALNGLAFAFSSMANTGEVSLRGIASQLTGVMSLMGKFGAIGAITATIGLSIFDVIRAGQKRAIDRMALDSQTAIRNSLTREKAALDLTEANQEFAYSQGLASLKDFYRERSLIIEQRTKAEVAARRNEAAALEREAGQRERFVQIGGKDLPDALRAETLKQMDELLARARTLRAEATAAEQAGVAEQTRNAQQRIAAERQLRDQVLGFEAQRREAQGQTHAMRLEEIEREAADFRKALSQQGVAQDEATARVKAFTDAMRAQAGLAQAQLDITNLQTQLDTARLAVQQELEQGKITEREASQKVADIENSMLPTLREMVQRALEFAAALGDQGAVQALKNLQAQMNGLGRDLSLDRLRADMNNRFASLGGAIGMTLGGALADGIQSALTAGSGKNFFEAFGNVLLSGLGNIFVQLGAELITYGLIMSGLLPFLSNPFTSGPAAIAAGTALVAAGAAMGAIAANNSGRRTGGGSGGRASVTASSEDSRIFVAQAGSARRQQSASALGGMQAAPALNPVTLTVGLLNPNDPSSQRLLATAIGNAQRRGY